MIRLIASDLDGTLLSRFDTIHPENLRAIREAMSYGVHFAAVSGRSAAACSILMQAHGLDDAHILGVNGCHVLDRPFGRTLEAHLMGREAARRAIEVALAHELEACLYTQDAIIYADEESLIRHEGGANNPNQERLLASAGLRVVAGMDAMEAGLAGRPMKTFCIARPGQDNAAFLAAREETARIPGVSMTSSWHNNYEAMPEGVDKGTALASLAARLGIGPDEVLAFGDNENDLPMLMWAGHGYAVENAQDIVKQSVCRTTGQCMDGGVAQAIHALMAQGLIG